MLLTHTENIFVDERLAPYSDCPLVRHTDGTLGWLVNNKTSLVHTLANHIPVKWKKKDFTIIPFTLQYTR